MKNLLLLFTLCLLHTAVAAQPYAPWAKLKAGAPEVMRKGSIPSSDEVGIPCYPGAVMLSVHNPAEGAENAMAPYMNLASEDPPEKVEAWYKVRLSEMPGWNYHDTYGFFYKGDDAMKAMSMQLPYLNVMELGQVATDVIYVDDAVKKNLKTRIQIVYRPGENE